MDSPTFGARSPEPPQPDHQRQQAQQMAEWDREWEQSAYEQRGRSADPDGLRLTSIASARLRQRGEEETPTAIALESRSLYHVQQNAWRRGWARRAAQQGLGSTLQQPRYAAAAMPAQSGLPTRNPIRDDALRTDPHMPPGDDFRDTGPVLPRSVDAGSTRSLMPQGAMPRGDDFRDMWPVTPPANGAGRSAANGTPSPSSPRQANAGTHYQPYPSPWQQPPSGRGPRGPRGPGGAGGSR